MKVGDYVRTKDGLIRKIVEIDKLIYIDKDYISDEPEYHNSLIEEDVIKTSSNLIDLIEVGDYVNGYLIEKVYDVFETSPNKLKEAHVRYADEDFISQLYDTEIKSIVTHEQFSQIEYKVGEQ